MIGLRRWWRGVPPLAADSALVVALLVVAAVEYTNSGDDGHQAGPLWLNVPLTVLELVPLAFRRRAPVLVLSIMCAVVGLPSLVVDHTLYAYTGYFPLAFALYTVARHRDVQTARWALLLPPVALLAYAVNEPAIRDGSDAFFAAIVFTLSWLVGAALRRQAHQRAALADALERLGREQQERERLAVVAERAHLARDLHDVVAHAVTLMLVQVGAARLALDDDLEAARASLLAVERTGREATGDLRRLLDLLREDARPGDPDPAAALDDVRALAEAMDRAGLRVRLEVRGEPRPLSPSLSQSAYRVVQEALTNVLKHAGPTEVRVMVDWENPLRIEVVDAGPRGQRPPAPVGGHGLMGMRERVTLFGGHMRAAVEDGGFAVRVELPVPRA